MMIIGPIESRSSGPFCSALCRVEIVKTMLKREKKSKSPRDRELLLGHLVTWGSIIIGLILAIALAPVIAAEKDQSASTPTAEAALDSATSIKG